jgi:hypothetical protein
LTPTCWACGSPWFEPDHLGTLRCCTCDADYSRKPASRRISADNPTAIRLYDGTPFEGRLDSCSKCPLPDRMDIHAPYHRQLEDDLAVCSYECHLGHRWSRCFRRRMGTPPAPPKKKIIKAPDAAGRISGFRAFVHKMAKQGDVAAEEILGDPNFPYAPENPDAWAKHFEKSDAGRLALDALDDLWDAYRFGKPVVTVEKLHDQAKIVVETYKHYCTLTVDRDELVDQLQLKWDVPAGAERAKIELPSSVQRILGAFQPVTLAMFIRLQYRGPWTHLTGPRYYTLHVPVAYQHIAVNALRAAELLHESKPLEALLTKLSAETAEDTAIYKWTDIDGLPIYYGITKDMHSRQNAHARYGAWGVFAAGCTVERRASRDAALAREKELIQLDRPIFNRQHNDTPEARDRLAAYLSTRGRLDLLAR